MLNVFVLEDETNDWISIKQAFSDDSNVNLTRFSDTNSALEEIGKQYFPYDLSLLDINIEDGTDNDGFIIAKALLRHHSIPIVFLTKHYDSESYTEKAIKLGIPARYFVNKDDLRNPLLFAQLLEDAIEEFVEQNERIQLTQLLLADRKVGIRNAAQAYTFYGQDEILYLEGDENATHFYGTNGQRLATYGNQIKPIAEQIMRVFPNFVRLGSYCVNITKIRSLHGRQLYLTSDSGEPIRLDDISPRGVSKLRLEGLLIKTRAKN